MTETAERETRNELVRAVKQKTMAIPLMTPQTEAELFSERHQACFFTGHRDIIAPGGISSEQFQQQMRLWLEEQVESILWQSSMLICIDFPNIYFVRATNSTGVQHRYYATSKW